METGNTFVDGLNKPQKEAVIYCDGPSLVIAGAGSGKTRGLTHKIAYLISKGMDPHRIMALTFTNKLFTPFLARYLGLKPKRLASRAVIPLTMPPTRKIL